MKQTQRGIIIVMMGGTVEHTRIAESLPRCLSLDTPPIGSFTGCVDDSNEDVKAIDTDDNNKLSAEKPLGFSISSSTFTIQESTLSISKRVALKIADILGFTENWGAIIEEYIISIASKRALSFSVLESQRISLEDLAGVTMALKNTLEYTSNYDLYLRDENKRTHRSYSAFHNAIYGVKFRQSKKSTKLQAKANKVNARRNRNSLIKNRIHNYNKPATV